MFGVTVATIAPCVVSQVSHHVWCRGCRTVCGVAGITPCGVAGVVPCGATGVTPRVVSRSRSLCCGVVVAVIAPHCVMVTFIVLRGAAVAITVVTVVVVGGWAVVGPGGRGQLHVHRQGEEHRNWTGKEEISRKKKKRKERKEKRTSRG